MIRHGHAPPRCFATNVSTHRDHQRINSGTSFNGLPHHSQIAYIPRTLKELLWKRCQIVPVQVPGRREKQLLFNVFSKLGEPCKGFSRTRLVDFHLGPWAGRTLAGKLTRMPKSNLEEFVYFVAAGAGMICLNTTYLTHHLRE